MPAGQTSYAASSGSKVAVRAGLPSSRRSRQIISMQCSIVCVQQECAVSADTMHDAMSRSLH